MEIERITEETARKLEECSRAANEFCEKFEELCKNATKSLVNVCIERMFYYAEKCTNATFITRWYWKRRLVNLVKAIREIEDQFTKEYGIDEADNGGKLKKVIELADAMYYAAQNLTTVASRLHKAMNEYYQFKIKIND